MSWGKRFFDLFWTTVGLVFLIPLFFIVGVLIKLEDGGPVFFKQKRIGYKGKGFYLWKFRTMEEGADKKGLPLTTSSDPRITKIGKKLRKYKIDELPQLFNVLKGEMSLVGPRPEVKKYVSLYSVSQKKVLELVPGITDPASIKFRNENEILSQSEEPEKKYIDEIMPEKIKINLEYSKNSSLMKDLFIIIKTLFKIA